MSNDIRQLLLGEKEQPDNRNHARRYISYRNLLATGRAVRKQKSFVWYSTAGNDPQVLRLRCASGQEAKRTAMTLGAELRKARSDEQYNAALAKFLAEIRSAWPDQQQDVHVHTCDRGRSGQGCPPNPETGVTLCGFDWTEHMQSLDCPCSVELDDSFDANGVVRFVVHKAYKREAIVSV